MFGPFSAGDSLRVYRLQRHGISLDLPRGMTRPQSPLWEAWLAFLSQQAMGRPTYVLYDPQDGEAFIQVRYRPHQAAADVTYLAPSLVGGNRAAHAWLRLLDGICLEAAGQGIERIFANVPESGAEVEVFCQAGFTPYAREEILWMPMARLEPHSGETFALRPQRPEDWPALQKLCVAITPQRVRQVEGGIVLALDLGGDCRRFVLTGENDHEVVASLSLCCGPLACWLRMLVHPEAEQMTGCDPTDLVEVLVRRMLAEIGLDGNKKLYCNVRQYEAFVRQGLERVGFELYVARTLLVKHTLAWTRTPVQELAPALKGGAKLVPPAYHIGGERGPANLTRGGSYHT
ncbi:MAG: hypothetical protein ACUVWZ_16060 [Anaerolineae bacterium]